MRTLLILLALSPTCLLAACGGDDTESTASAPTATSTPAAASGGGATTVKASEFKFDPATLSAKAGKVKLTLDNTGQFEHELVVLKTDAKPDALKVSGDKVGEDDSVGEIGEIKGGATKSHTFDLKPGHYVYVCNIPTHYGKGMRGELVVK
jgi:plastocyanin